MTLAPNIFGVGDTAAYARSYNRAEDKQFARLLSFDTNGNKTLALTMPFMFEDCAKKLPRLLASPILAKVCRLI